jgi:PLP dependent protein
VSADLADVDPAAVAANVARVRERIAAAAARAGRDPGGVRLVAVSKLFPVAAVRAVVAAGVGDVGENYAQDLEAKAAEVPGVRWHFVGRLQRNKAAVLVRVGALVHSLDSLAGARALGRRAHAAGTTARALVQVEVDEREAAHGVAAADLPAFVAACRRVEGLEVTGLMAMPAPVEDPEAARPAFRRAAELAGGLGLPELSMGMTADFEVAVEEGATLVRVGTALFGPRPERGGRR